jgi:hypothetical protein
VTIKALQPKVSNRKIAKMLGVHHRTIDRDTGANAPLGRTKNPRETEWRWRKCANLPIRRCRSEDRCQSGAVASSIPKKRIGPEGLTTRRADEHCCLSDCHIISSERRIRTAARRCQICVSLIHAS